MASEVRINVRTRPETKRDLEIAARLRGITPSSFVNQAVVNEIRKEKEREPSAFVQTVVLNEQAAIDVIDDGQASTDIRTETRKRKVK